MIALVAQPFPFPGRRARVPQFCFPVFGAISMSRVGIGLLKGKLRGVGSGSAYNVAASNCYSNCHPTLRGGLVGSLADSGVILLLQHRNLQLE